MIEVLGSNEENKLPIYKYSGKTSFLDSNLFFCDRENDLKKCNFPLNWVSTLIILLLLPQSFW